MVTLKDGEPYSLWQPVSLAHRATQARLQLRRQARFLPSQFPGKYFTHPSDSTPACENLLRNVSSWLSRGPFAAPGHLPLSGPGPGLLRVSERLAVIQGTVTGALLDSGRACHHLTIRSSRKAAQRSFSNWFDAGRPSLMCQAS